MNIEKIKEVFADEAFVKSLLEMQTPAEVQAALKEKNIEFTEEEILGAKDYIIKAQEGDVPQEMQEVFDVIMEDGELTDEMLEKVAGGIGPILGGALLALAVVGVMCAAVGVGVGIQYLNKIGW